MQIFTAKYIFDGNTLLENTAIIVENKIITAVIASNKIMHPELVKDYGDTVITPGFIDLQLNGCGGVLFNDDISHNALEIMYQICLKYGTTSYLPTLITCDFENVITALDVTKNWFIQYGSTRGVIGLHLEGPFISKVKKGIHPEEFIIQPSNELLAKIVAYQQYFPIKLTIAPEEFTEEQLHFLISHNVIVSLGHSNASYAESEKAINLGAKTSTHIFNAMSGLTGRNPGVIAAIFNNNIYNGLIADMIHVDKANIQFLTKIKPKYTYLVTDAVTPMGTDMTQFELAGKTLFVVNGKCVDKNNVIGGAYLTMPEAVANCVDICQISLTQALNMASLIPANVMGYNNILGKISVGFRADLIAFDIRTHSCQIVG